MTVDEWMKQKNIADYGSHLEPIIRLAFEAGAENTLQKPVFLGWDKDLLPPPGGPREIPLPIRTTDRVYGTTVYAQGRCDFVDSIFGQCILEAGHGYSHAMNGDHDG